MKRKLTFLSVGFAAAFLFSAVANAADVTSSGLMPASQIKGTDVMNLQNQSIGDIDEVLVDPSTGRIRFLVLGVGGFLGIGETEVAVPWDAFKVSRNGDDMKFTLDASKERLEKAPRVEGKNYDRLFAREHAEPSFVYWGISWYDVGPSPSASPGASASPSPRASVSPPLRPSATPAGAAHTSPAPSPHK